MSAVFLKILNMGIAAGWLILAVIVLRWFVRKAPKWLTCIFWAIVAVRLVCPFSLESPFSLIPSAETISPAVVQYAQKPAIDSGIASIDSTWNPLIGEAFAPAPLDSVNPLYIWTAIGSIIWVIGLTIMLGYAFYSFLRLRGSVREAVRLRDNIWLCDGVRSPFILGIMRPRIYLPSDLGFSSGMGDGRMKCILAHEEAHLKRRDHWWKPLGYLLLAVYWFHPLVWIAYILLCRDIELACDEKVIRDMDLEGKKTYSDALVACSIRRKMVMACPLAFGEVGVKERVRAVLNYRRPAFWIVLAAVLVCVTMILCFLTNPRRDTFDVKVVIPANSGQTFHYSEEEISPYRDRVILSAGEGLGDTEVVLKPVEGCTKEDAYEPTYMTPGWTTKMNAEKGAWFKVGVIMGNPTDEDMIVYVRVKGVQVRIGDYAADAGWEAVEDAGADTGREAMRDAGADTGKGTVGDAGADTGREAMRDAGADTGKETMGDPRADAGKETGGDPGVEANREDKGVAHTDKWEETQSLLGASAASDISAKESADAAITAAILEENKSSYPGNCDFACCDFVTLATLSATPLAGDTTHTITYYGWALYEQYNVSAEGIEDMGGNHIPVALTFTLDENGYELKEYWQPRPGSYFVPDIQDKFPTYAAADGIDSQKFIVQQLQSCYRQVVEITNLNTEVVIGNLLDKICSEPGTSSSPHDYIKEHDAEYRELIYYGGYTLRYCFGRFEQGDETGLEGKVMAIVCEELLQTKGSIPLDADTAQTGQLWYDTLYAHGGNLVEPYL